MNGVVSDDIQRARQSLKKFASDPVSRGLSSLEATEEWSLGQTRVVLYWRTFVCAMAARTSISISDPVLLIVLTV